MDLDLESEGVCLPDLDDGRLDDVRSISLSERPGDLPRFKSFRGFDVLLLFTDSSSIVEIVVAAVAVEFDRCENLVRLSPALVVCVYIDDPLLIVDLERLWTLTEPPKKSPIAEPGRPLNKFRDIASRPKMAVRDRLLAVGVDGREFCPVRNLNNPN